MSTRTPIVLIQLVTPPVAGEVSAACGGPLMLRLENGLRVSQDGRILFELAYVAEGQCPAAPEPIERTQPVAFLELRYGDHGQTVPAGPGIALDLVKVGDSRDPGSFASETVFQTRNHRE